MKKFFLNKKRLEIIALIIILSFSAYLRLHKIRDYMTFLGDEGRDVMVVRKMIVTLHPVFLGPTASVGGFFLGPLYYYFMIPFLLLFRFDPVGPAVMVGLFGVTTVGLVYLVGKRFFGIAAGLAASSLYALSPIVIAYSRSSWNPNLVPFFSLFLIYALHEALMTKKTYWYTLVGICYGAGLQFHYLFTFLLPVGAVYFLINRKIISNKLRSAIFVSFGFLSVTFPFIGFEIKNHFPNTRSIWQFVTAGKEVAAYGASVASNVSDIAFRLFSRLVYYFPPSEQWYLFNQTQLGIWRTIVVVSSLLSVALIVWSVVKKRTSSTLLLILWLFFGVGLFFFYRRAVYDYYLGIMFPLPFLFIGNLFGKAYALPWVKWIGIVLIFGLLIFNWSGRPFKHPPNRQLEQAEKTARFVFEKTSDKAFNFALITGGNSDHAYRYFFELWRNAPVTIENTVNDPGRKTVTDQLLIICEIGGCKPLGHPLWEIAGFGRAEIAGEWQVGVLQVFKLVHFNGQMIQ